MLDCQERKKSIVKSTCTTSFIPRQLLLSTSSSKSRMGAMGLQDKEIARNTNISLAPQDRVFLLHTICQFLDLNGFNKTLKKFCGEADIKKSGWKDCSVSLEEMFQEHLRKRNDTDKRTKEIHVEDGKKLEAALEIETINDKNMKPKKKKKNKSGDYTSERVDVETHLKTSAEPAGDTLNESAKVVKKLKNKQKDISEPSDKDLKEQPVEDTASETVKKSKDKKKYKDELEKLDNDSQGEKTSKKSDDTEGKKTKEDISISKVEVDVDEKRSKKRKKSSSDDNPAGYNNEDNSKRRKMDVSDKSNGTAPAPKTPKETANGFTETDYTHKEDTTKETNGSTEPTGAKAFQRVKAEEVKFVDDRLKDNSYWAKDGADSGYGAKAQEVLGQVRGRDFRHEKTKKKRGTYRGGQIDLQSHSIKFNYDEEDEE